MVSISEQYSNSQKFLSCPSKSKFRGFQAYSKRVRVRCLHINLWPYNGSIFRILEIPVARRSGSPTEHFELQTVSISAASIIHYVFLCDARASDTVLVKAMHPSESCFVSSLSSFDYFNLWPSSLSACTSTKDDIVTLLYTQFSVLQRFDEWNPAL